MTGTAPQRTEIGLVLQGGGALGAYEYGAITALLELMDEMVGRGRAVALKAVTGDPQLAALISLDPSRPHLYLDAAPERTPWMSLKKFNETGGVVVWRAADTVGTPPPDIAQRFPGLVPEVPRAFEWLVTGRQPLLRIGWAIVRPKTP